MDRESLWNRWDEIDGLLEQALERPVEERDAFLTRACADDPELLRILRTLVGAARREGGPDPPGPALLGAALGGDGREEHADALLGATVGPYRLVGILGTGGMGVVYLAERADGVFERQVAVKVLHRSLDAPDIRHRFRLERQILASLNHPGIAQMIDGGVTDDGRPYLVMEHVEGIPIDRYADGRGLTIDERIRLVIATADAVEYAHRHMVIHRDLKPSNILVTDEGRVKLLDFGIAKLLADREEAEALTRPGARFVTPEYAAPEQLLGEPMTTQSDVYALTVLLFQLLTGVLPYSRRGPDSVLERVIRGAEPTAPSEAVRRLSEPEATAEVGDSVFKARSTTAAALRRTLDGDLDAILLHGLRSRPEDRYGSAAALRDDLERYLSGAAVTVRGDLILYRARKFARRHRVSVGAAAALFLVVTGSAVGLGLQRRAVVAERNRAEAAAAAASREAETSRQVTAFLVGLFKGSDPREQLGDTVTARALLERGAARVDVELADQPAVRVALLEALGQVYTNLGSYDRATELLQEATVLRRDSIEGRPGLAASMLLLADAQRMARAYRDARETYGAAIRHALESADSATLGLARLGLGATFVMMEQPDSAETELQAGLDLLTATDARDETVSLNAQTTLAGLLRRKGDLEGSERLYRSVAARRRAMEPRDPVALATVLNNLAVLRRRQGDLAGAASLYREAMDLDAAVLGPGHPTSLMLAGNLAGTLSAQGRWDESLAVYRARVDAARERWPDGHWQTASALMNLGAALVTNDRPADALSPLSEAVDMAIEQMGARHSWTNVYRGWLGSAAALTGRAEAADQLFQWSLEGLSSYEGLGSDQTVKSMLESLIRTLDAKGLATQVTDYRAILEAAGGP